METRFLADYKLEKSARGSVFASNELESIWENVQDFEDLPYILYR